MKVVKKMLLINLYGLTRVLLGLKIVYTCILYRISGENVQLFLFMAHVHSGLVKLKQC